MSMDMGAIGILFSYLLIVAMSATVVTMVVVYARRVPRVEELREFDSERDESSESGRQERVKRRSRRMPSVGRGIRGRASPVSLDDYEVESATGVAWPQTREAERVGVLGRVRLWLAMQKARLVSVRQSKAEYEVELAASAPVQSVEPEPSSVDEFEQGGELSEELQIQMGVDDSKAIVEEHEKTSSEDAAAAAAGHESESDVDTDRLTKEDEASMEERFDVQSDQAVGEQRSDISQIGREDGSADAVKVEPALSKGETEGDVRSSPEATQMSTEPSEPPAEPSEDDRKAPADGRGMGDLSELFAKTTSEKATNNVLAEQMDDIDASELLRKGRELLNSLTRSDG